MEHDNRDANAGPAERLNYFNYFTEIEEEFVRRRGKPLLISPMDWALIETWKTAGIPLHIVLRAINQAFDAYDARAQKHRKVNSLFYCQQQVDSTFADYRVAQVGGSSELTQPSDEEATPGERSDKAEAFPKDILFEFLARCDEQLLDAAGRISSAERLAVKTAIERARARLADITNDVRGSSRVDAEALERDLDSLDRMILDAARASCGESELKELQAEARSYLRGYKKKMDKAIYEQTVQNFISRRLREKNNIPRMSLFFL